MKCLPDDLNNILQSIYWKDLSSKETVVFTRWLMNHEEFKDSPAIIAKVLNFTVDSVRVALRGLVQKEVLVREGSNHTKYAYRLHESMLDPRSVQRMYSLSRNDKEQARQNLSRESLIIKIMIADDLFGKKMLLDLIAKPAMLSKNAVSRTLTSLVKLGFIRVVDADVMGTRTFEMTDKIKDKDISVIIQEIENEVKHGLQ